jgi:general secretion pathway protein N
MTSHAARITLAAMLLLGRADAFFAVPPLVVDPSDVGVAPGRIGPSGANPSGTNPGGANPGRANPGGANPGGVKTAPDGPAKDRSAADNIPTGNPLWAIPLKQLSATRDRPIFTPSRRPPPPAVVAPYIAPVPPPPVTWSEPETPPLTLVGMVVSEHDGIGVFVEQNTQNIVRLRMGESYTGWILRHLEGREATLEKDRQTAVLAMPAAGSEGAKIAIPIDVGRANR